MVGPNQIAPHVLGILTDITNARIDAYQNKPATDEGAAPAKADAHVLLHGRETIAQRARRISSANMRVLHAALENGRARVTADAPVTVNASVTRAGRARTAPSASRTSTGHICATLVARRPANAQVMAGVLFLAIAHA